ncbi:MAG: hypothetical protein JWM20_659 [Patescibacteria group bacterium]|nr:hypothetical protein [Patescibacteria group bacterium]
MGGFVAFMILLFVAWIISGGPQRAVQTGSANDKYQEELSPLGNGRTYDKLKDKPAAEPYQLP